MPTTLQVSRRRGRTRPSRNDIPLKASRITTQERRGIIRFRGCDARDAVVVAQQFGKCLGPLFADTEWALILGLRLSYRSSPIGILAVTTFYNQP